MQSEVLLVILKTTTFRLSARVRKYEYGLLSRTLGCSFLYFFSILGLAELHVVPHTFLDKWHTEVDNLTNLHWPTIQNMNRIISEFVYEYLKKHVD